MTLKLGPHRSPRGGWDNQLNVFGPDLRELFVKRATLLRSVTIVFNEDTKVEIMNMWQSWEDLTQFLS